MINTKKIYSSLLKRITTIIGIDAAKKFDTKLRFHKSLNLKNPTTLSDKVSYIELHEQSPLASMCTDKFEVRKYVADKGLVDILVPLVGGPWKSIDEIDFAKLPNSFALKATHGCKMNYLVSDKSKLDMEHCKKEMQRWLATTYGTYSMEPHYASIPHRIYAEKLLNEAEELVDYKFHCLNGLPYFVLVCSNRKANGDDAMQVTLDLFSTEWTHIDEIIPSGLEVAGNGLLSKPSTFEEMKYVAEQLSADFKFVRVDLYELNGKVCFGEMTFSPACCVFPYFTEKFDRAMGKILKL